MPGPANFQSDCEQVEHIWDETKSTFIVKEFDTVLRLFHWKGKNNVNLVGILFLEYVFLQREIYCVGF